MDLLLFFLLLISTIYLEGGDCGTVQTSATVRGTVGSSMDLPCTYTASPGDRVYAGSIAWQSMKSGTSDFENIALFSPPGEGSNSFTTTESAENFKDRAELLNVTSIGSDTFRVVLRLLEVQCSDEREYQCFVSFNNQNTGPQTDSVITSLTVQAPAEQPYEIPAPNLSNIEENMKIDLSCTANVGKPPGKIKWWRYRGDQISSSVLVAESSEIPVVQPGVCEYNVTFSIQPVVTKDDDQSVWRCSVDNALLTSSPDHDKPYQETARINVFYKVDIPNISIFPNVTSYHYSVGSTVTLTCVAQGNPSPSTNIDKDINRYIWTFKANPGDNATELRSNYGVLSLNNLQETDTGTYTCTAFNGFNGKVFNTSKDEQLYIVNTFLFPASTSTFTEGPTGNENTQPQTAGGDFGTAQTSATVTGTLGSSVDLTCTYTLGPGDIVYASSIAWKSKKSGTSDFENIALFSPPGEGSNSFTTTESAQNFKDRAELLNVTSIGSDTFRVVLRLLEVQCSDEREYQCFVSFNNQNTGPQIETAITSLIVQAPAEKPYGIRASDLTKIKENTKVTLSCASNVGKPPGKIKWWRYRDQTCAPFFVAESSEIPMVQPGMCEYNVTFSIQPVVTKDDDQSVWRCSVDNDLLTSLPDQDKPYQETARIIVYYNSANHGNPAFLWIQQLCITVLLVSISCVLVL